jgi:Tol biopolymer transport system component
MLLVLTSCQGETNPVVEIEDKYFNQRKVGLTPEIFAPGVITTSTTSEFARTYSPDYKYYFFTRRNVSNANRLYYSENISGEWTTPAMSPISDDVAEFEPFITPDGKYLYFGSKRDGNSSLVIFRSEFIDGTWNDPIFVNNGLNDGFAMYISVTNTKNIYYTTMEGIYILEYVDGEYLHGAPSGVTGAHSFISPDESFMLLDDSGGDNEYTSIYITYIYEGEWSEPIKLDETVNLDGSNQICASISPDGEFLFFSRFTNGSSDIYWVDASILDKYNPSNQQ